MKTALAVGALALLTGCASRQAAAPHEADLDRLAAWMTGEFSSREQALADPENFRDIRLFMTPVWKSRDDGRWLYVEQAAGEALGRPYRQRIYRLTALPDGRLESAVFLLPGEALDYAGAWSDPSMLHGLSPADLTARDGCSIFLREEGASFRGSTVGRGCPSDLRGASYATSEAVITDDGLVTWDRGYNDQGVQVWGATRGGYVFKRTRSASRPAPVQ